METQLWPLTSNFTGKMPYTPTKVLPVVMDENDIGAPNVRPRSTRARKYHTMSFVFSRIRPDADTQSEWELINSWIENNLAMGSQPFYFPVPGQTDYNNQMLVRFALDKMGNNWFNSINFQPRYAKVEFVLEELN